jgi:TolB-like protein/Tfp pilus assembly protein PilF
MKRCPQCLHVYTDETLKFCRDDGAPLQVNGSSSLESSETLILPATRTGDAPTQLLQSETARAQETTSLPNTPSGLKTGVSDIHTTSSAEYLVSRITNHKRGVALGSIILLALISLGYWFSARRPSTDAIGSIAVLPFQNKSADADTEYLSDGLAESLIYRLSQLPNLKISPASSVFRYKGDGTDARKVGNELEVDTVMTGRIARRGDNLTISVELVDVRNDKLIWGERYERKLSELLATQREIAAAITQNLQIKLSGVEKGLTKEYTDSNEAYQLFLKGRFHFAKRTKEDVLRSIEVFRQAIKLDPGFALAYVGIAESFAVMPSFGYLPPKEAFPEAKAAIAKALELDPELPEAHTVAGLIAAQYYWEWAEAERHFKRALELRPDLASAHYRYASVYLSPMGRHDEAIAGMKRAMELEPLSLIQGANFAGVYVAARQYDLAFEQARKTYELDPHFLAGRVWLCNTYNVKGMYAESLSICGKTLTPNTFISLPVGYAYVKVGRRQEARGVINGLKESEKSNYVSNYGIAIIHVALGEKDAAFAELEKAYQARDWYLPRLKVDPSFDPLRDDPRFHDLLRRVGLPS